MLAAIALIPPIAWEPPYTAGVALKSKKTKKQRDNSRESQEVHSVPCILKLHDDITSTALQMQLDLDLLQINVYLYLCILEF